MLGSNSSNCSIQSKQIRNQIYYQQNKENLKNGKLRFTFNIEVKSDENDRLNAIKTKIAFVKRQLHLGATAVNAQLMEVLLDTWLKHNETSPETPRNQLHPSVAIRLVPDVEMDDPELASIAELPPEMFQVKTQLHSQCNENDQLYLVSGSAIDRLFQFLTMEQKSICQCGHQFDYSTLKTERVTENNHCCKVAVGCMADEGHTLEWFSSPIISGKYYANLR